MNEIQPQRSFWSFGMITGLTLLVIGIVLFLWARNVLTGQETLAYFFIGIGIISLLDILARHLGFATRWLMWFRLMFAFLMLALGGAILGGIGDWWPLIIILLGAGILVNALLGLIRK